MDPLSPASSKMDAGNRCSKLLVIGLDRGNLDPIGHTNGSLEGLSKLLKHVLMFTRRSDLSGIFSDNLGSATKQDKQMTFLVSSSNLCRFFNSAKLMAQKPTINHHQSMTSPGPFFFSGNPELPSFPSCKEKITRHTYH